MSLSEEATQLIQELKRNARVVLATDNMDCFRRFTVPTQNFALLFDDILESSSLGRMKKDEAGRTFTDYATSHSIAPERTYLIDDSERTCELFRSIGGVALQTKGKTDTLVHLQTIKNLFLP